jgi:hypothetical protein
VNNQLIDALAQIRDSLQHQQMQQQQHKIQQQLIKQQQHLQQLSSSLHGKNTSSTTGSGAGYDLHAQNNNRTPISSSYDRVSWPHPHQLDVNQPYGLVNASNSINRVNNNTTKVLINSGNNENMNACKYESESDSNRNSASSYLGEQALKMLAELKSSSC